MEDKEFNSVGSSQLAVGSRESSRAEPAYRQTGEAETRHGGFDFAQPPTTNFEIET
jgi:hypothetical protein